MTDPVYDDIIHADRQIRVIWRGAEFIPPRSLVTQASGVCFTEDGRVVWETKDGISWQLAGGHPEPGESIEQAFVREVAEETGAEVLEMRYLGAQEVNDPDNPYGMKVYYQARFWAKVRLGEFKPQFEMIERVCFAPKEVKAALAWQTVNVLDQLLSLAVEKE
jgi:8-oxo-dGTP pyrophosphatase MutT (NUDIX family)